MLCGGRALGKAVQAADPAQGVGVGSGAQQNMGRGGGSTPVHRGLNSELSEQAAHRKQGRLCWWGGGLCVYFLVVKLGTALGDLIHWGIAMVATLVLMDQVWVKSDKSTWSQCSFSPRASLRHSGQSTKIRSQGGGKTPEVLDSHRSPKFCKKSYKDLRQYLLLPVVPINTPRCPPPGYSTSHSSSPSELKHRSICVL